MVWITLIFSDIETSNRLELQGFVCLRDYIKSRPKKSAITFLSHFQPINLDKVKHHLSFRKGFKMQNEKHISQIMERALELSDSSHQDFSPAQWKAVADELGLSENHVNRALSLVQSNSESIGMPCDLEMVHGVFRELIEFKESGFCKLKNGCEEIGDNQIVFKVQEGSGLSFLSPYYILSLRQLSPSHTQLSWSLHLKQYQERIFGFCSIAILACLMACSFSPGCLFFIPMFLLVIHESRTSVKRKFERMIHRDIHEVERKIKESLSIGISSRTIDTPEQFLGFQIID